MNPERIKNWLVVWIALLFPWHSQVQLPIGGVNMSFGDPIIVLVGILVLLGVFKLNTLPSFSKQIFALLIMILISFVIAVFRYPMLTNPGNGIGEIIKMLASVTYFFAVIVLFTGRTAEKIYTFSLVTAVAATIFSIWTIIENILGFHRPSGPFENPNLYADYLLFSFFTVWYLIDQNNSGNEYKYNKYLILVIPLLTISLIGTESRSAVISLLIGIGVIFCIKYNTYLYKVRIKPTSLAFPLAAATCTVAVLLYSDWRIFRRFEALLDGSATGGRFDRWALSLDILFETSLLGVGWGQHPQYLGTTRFLHNSLVQATLDGGIIVGLLLVLLWVLVLRRGFQMSLINDRNYAGYITAFIFASVLNSMFHNNLNFRSFWIALGLIGALELYHNRSDLNYDLID